MTRNYAVRCAVTRGEGTHWERYVNPEHSTTQHNTLRSCISRYIC